MNRRRGFGAAMRRANMSLWLWPSVTALTAFAIGTGLSTVTLGTDSFAGMFFKAGPSGARTVLTALVGGLVTALSVIFSLAITGLQVVHQQYSPRLMRNFMRDRATKITLGVFAGSVAYMLAVLRALPPTGSPDPIPRLAVVVAMVLFMACVGVVAYFAQHITDSIRVHKAMQRVASESDRAIDLAAEVVARRRGPDRSEHAAENLDMAGSVALTATRTGYVQEIDLDAIAEIAARHGVVVRLGLIVGDQVMAGTPIAQVAARDGADLAPVRAELQRGVDAHVEVGRDRSTDTDVAYGFRQLVDVAVRAMSPSLNDPYTAMQAIDHLGGLLCRLAGETFDDGVRYGEDGRVLVSMPVLGLSDLVRLSCDQPLRYGGHEPAVAMRLLKLLRDMAAVTSDEMRPVLRDEADRIVDHAERNARPSDNLAPLRAEAEAVRDWAAGDAALPRASYLRL